MYFDSNNHIQVLVYYFTEVIPQCLSKLLFVDNMILSATWNKILFIADMSFFCKILICA